MGKGESPTTLVGIRQLLLRIAMMVSLVGLGGVLVKTGAVAQTTSSRVLRKAQAGEMHSLSHEETKFDKAEFTPGARLEKRAARQL